MVETLCQYTQLFAMRYQSLTILATPRLSLRKKLRPSKGKRRKKPGFNGLRLPHTKCSVKNSGLVFPPGHLEGSSKVETISPKRIRVCELRNFAYHSSLGSLEALSVLH